VDVSPSVGKVKVGQAVPSSYPGTFTFTDSALVQLEAVPVSGYSFENWSGDLNSTANPITILVDCDKNITANFSQIMHILTMQIQGNGSTTPPAGNSIYGEGTMVSITAIPDKGWRFDSWTGDVAYPGSATTVVAIDSDKIVAANFSKVMSVWWLIAGILIGVIIIGEIAWLVIRRQTA
jgi:hypothetical protein